MGGTQSEKAWETLRQKEDIFRSFLDARRVSVSTGCLSVSSVVERSNSLCGTDWRGRTRCIWMLVVGTTPKLSTYLWSTPVSRKRTVTWRRFPGKEKKRLFKLTQTNNQWRRSSEGFFLVSGGGGGATVDFSRGVQNNFFEEGTKDEISF